MQGKPDKKGILNTVDRFDDRRGRSGPVKAGKGGLGP
jgi:hypothetical protein